MMTNQTANTLNLDAYTEEEKAEIRDFWQRIQDGEITEEEEAEYLGHLPKDDTRKVRHIASTTARKNRQEIKAYKNRVHDKATKNMNKRNQRASRLAKRG